MKLSFLFLSAGVALLFFGTACERHPASQTIPNYEQQQAAHEKAAASKKIAPEGASSAPVFFPKEKS